VSTKLPLLETPITGNDTTLPLVRDELQLTCSVRVHWFISLRSSVVRRRLASGVVVYACSWWLTDVTKKMVSRTKTLCGKDRHWISNRTMVYSYQAH